MIYWSGHVEFQLPTQTYIWNHSLSRKTSEERPDWEDTILCNENTKCQSHFDFRQMTSFYYKYVPFDILHILIFKTHFFGFSEIEISQVALQFIQHPHRLELQIWESSACREETMDCFKQMTLPKKKNFSKERVDCGVYYRRQSIAPLSSTLPYDFVVFSHSPSWLSHIS